MRDPTLAGPVETVMRRFLLLPFLILATFLGAEPSSGELTRAAQEATTLAERKLLEIVARERALEERLTNAASVDRSQAMGEIRALSRDYQNYLARNREDLYAHLLYGKFLYRAGDNEGALQVFLAADNLDGNQAVTKQHIGNLLAEGGNFAEALNYFLQAIDLAPQEPVYHFSVGQVLAEYREDFLEIRLYKPATLDAQMQAAFHEAQALEPENADFAFRYGESFYDVAEPDWEIALGFWEDLAEEDLSAVQRDALALHVARVLVELGRFEQARERIASVEREAFAATKANLLARIEGAGE